MHASSSPDARPLLAHQRLATLLHKHRRAEPALYGDLDVSAQVDGLIVLDRAVDWVTPMCTQLTYEGLVDEFVGIRNGGWGTGGQGLEVPAL